jgi:1-acyl-sn-glycerol-3-phosphate acyltransferase
MITLRPVFSAFWRIRAVGVENIPVSGPAILAPNHTSVIDSFFMPATLPRRVTFVGKAEYLDDWKTRRLFPALGMIPIDRSGGDASTRALDTAAGLLEVGELFAIYPEGTRARDGYLHKGHTGAARLSLRTGAPIIPVGILGTRSIQPPDVAMPRPFRPVEVRFGRPISPAASETVADTRMRLRQITDELMFEIRALTGQSYVNDYATKGTHQAAETLQATIDPEMPERRSSAEVLRSVAV